MRRCARSVFTAVIITIVISILGAASPVPSARAAGTFRVFVPIASSPPSFWSPQELQAVDLINQHRRNVGCAPVQLNIELGVAAKNHSRDMAEKNYFSHTGLDGSTYWQRAQAASYQYWASGEIIGAGYTSGLEVVNGWMNSSGHRSIILTCNNDDIGIGFYSKSGSQWEHYWTAVFGQR
ncbi:MAG: CAP domain-containing protein [Chloroflexi bacterium]|nr:CAP domain-containing protein [Chloroflexota bacterium]